MKKVGVIILGIVLFSILKCEVHADTITYKRLDNLYYRLVVDGKVKENHVNAFYLDGRLAYCVEPGTEITTKDYEAHTNWNNVNLSQETIDHIEKIGYYGYEYPNHQTDKYHIATQELIWRAIRNVEITWTDSNGNIVDITKEKEEIEKLVNNHSLYPSFTNEILSGKPNETKTIIDTNNVLNNFSLSDSKYHKLQIEDNKLTITFNNENIEEEITLTRKKYDQKTLLVYRYPGSQNLAALRLSTNENLSFKIKTEETPKEIVKVPSTSDENKIIQFGILKFHNINHEKFN